MAEQSTRDLVKNYHQPAKRRKNGSKKSNAGSNLSHMDFPHHVQPHSCNSFPQSFLNSSQQSAVNAYTLPGDSNPSYPAQPNSETVNKDDLISALQREVYEQKSRIQNLETNFSDIYSKYIELLNYVKNSPHSFSGQNGPPYQPPTYHPQMNQMNQLPQHLNHYYPQNPTQPELNQGGLQQMNSGYPKMNYQQSSQPNNYLPPNQTNNFMPPNQPNNYLQPNQQSHFPSQAIPNSINNFQPNLPSPNNSFPPPEQQKMHSTETIQAANHLDVDGDSDYDDNSVDEEKPTKKFGGYRKK